MLERRTICLIVSSWFRLRLSLIGFGGYEGWGEAYDDVGYGGKYGMILVDGLKVVAMTMGSMGMKGGIWGACLEVTI